MTDLLPFVDVPANGEHSSTVIWLHGLGDSGDGFAPIVPALKLPSSLGVRFIFPHAPVRPVTINNGMEMRAWYDIKSLDMGSRADLTGVLESSAQVLQLIDKEIEKGIKSENIILAGFSQGGVIALHMVARLPYKIAGAMALSTYMCKPELLATEKHSANSTTPIMFAHGQQDPVVPISLGKLAFSTMQKNKFNVSWHEYAMQHSVSPNEIADISSWLTKQLS